MSGPSKKMLDKLNTDDLKLLLKTFLVEGRTALESWKRIIKRDLFDEKDIEKKHQEILKSSMLRLYFKLIEEDLERTLKETIESLVVERDYLFSCPLTTKEEVLDAWFNVYIPNGGQPYKFYTRVTNSFRDLFTYLVATGYSHETNQGGCQLHLNFGEDFEPQWREIDEVRRYLKPSKDGRQHFSISPQDSCESGVPSLQFEDDSGYVLFTRWSCTKEVFSGTAKEAAKYIWSHHYYTAEKREVKI